MESDAAWPGVCEELEFYEPLVRRFLQGDIAHPEWLLPHEYDGESIWPKPEDRDRIDQLRMLKFGEQDRPDMLLYGLGSLDQVDPQFAERLDRFMSHDDHTILLNTSGTGKTRMVFEVLSRTWGLYFTCASNQQTPYGSPDLRSVLGFLRGTRLSGHPTTWPEPLAENIRRACRNFYNIIAARLLVFRLFCDLVQSLNVEEQVARQRWLLLQLRSNIIFDTPDDDIFDRLRMRVSLLQPVVVEQELATLISSCAFSLAIIALDEANVASGMYETSYALSDGETHAPVLWEVVRCFSSSFPAQRLVVSGTRIDVNVVRDGIKSGTSDQSRVRTFCGLGSFDTIEHTKHYVHHFLGPLNKGQVARMHSWFQGRRRFLANCVEHMLMLGLNQLDAFIQMAVMSLSGFDTNDIEWELKHLYGLIRQDYELSGSFAARELREALFAYALRNQQTQLWSSVQDHVSLGLALLDDDTDHASIWEPLVFYRLFTWILNSPKSCNIEQLLSQKLDGPLQVSHSLSLVGGLASYLFRLHTSSASEPTKLCDYLTFQGVIPGWSDATAEIILPPSIRAGNVRIKYPSSFSITAAKHPDNVLSWLANGERPFLIPDDRLGADLIFFLRLRHADLGPTTVVLVTLQLTEFSRSARRRGTIVPIQPFMFYPKASRHRKAVKAVIKSLLPINARVPPYSMLRVLCFADPYRLPTKREPPVATLQVDALLQRSHEPELDVSYLHHARQKERHELDVVIVQ
ncbi:hypothetical protein BKA62DRAFT_365371 [Auriculariales sp. MPI-PUGE-AT-0066]|nr:hypothetical protein BKA62DRAFT_365371 [Auriculariales sp. MPI-PUGE-AT-0066]